MFRNYDVVKAKVDIQNQVKKGTMGAVLMVFDSDPVEYEVEFVDQDGESIAVLTVSEKELTQ